MGILLNYRKSLGNVLKNTYKLWDTRKISTTPTFMLFDQRLKRSSVKERERRYLEKDQLPPNYNLIYLAPMESYVIWSMYVSTVSAAIISSAAIYQYATFEEWVEPTDTALIFQSEDLYYFAAGFVILNAIMRFMVSRFPIRLYKSDEKYLAVYHPQLPKGVSHHIFNRGEVKPIYYIFSPWNNATYKLGSKTSLLLEDYFKTPSEFHEMCGLK